MIRLSSGLRLLGLDWLVGIRGKVPEEEEVMLLHLQSLVTIRVRVRIRVGFSRNWVLCSPR